MYTIYHYPQNYLPIKSTKRQEQFDNMNWTFNIVEQPEKKKNKTITISLKRNQVKPMINHKINNTFTSQWVVRRIKSFSIKLVQKP